MPTEPAKGKAAGGADRGRLVRLRILVSVEGEDAKRLERMAEERGKKPGDVVAELLRDADRSAA